MKRWDGKTGRVDLHLAVKSQEFDRTHHLVVELKAPGITLGRKELDQVEDYANVVLSNAAFATDKAGWDFILVGTNYDDLVENRFTGDHALGQFLNPTQKPGHPRVRAYVRRWRDIIDENRRRLAFMTTNLEHDPTLDEGLEQSEASTQTCSHPSYSRATRAQPTESSPPYAGSLNRPGGGSGSTQDMGATMTFACRGYPMS